MFTRAVLVFLVSFFLCSQCTPITNLPGLTFTPNFAQYSGYITLNQTTQASIFYWFVESQNNPATDPVLLWLQGGPGCSGMIGFFEEHGPFYIDTNLNLVPNPYSWNRYASVIYVESPIGVGFSYSNDRSDYITNDNKTAANTYQFLQNFFQTYPQFSTNPLWITGESYGGVYVPMVVDQIVNGPNAQLKSNLQGFSVGNPVTSCPELKLHSMDVQLNTYYFNGFIGLRQLKSWQDSGCAQSETAGGCPELYRNITSALGPVEGSDIYYNYCTGNGTLNAFEQVPGCLTVDERTTQYLNLPNVQAAIFAKPTAWEECSYPPNLYYELQGQNMMNYYNEFFQVAPQLSILVYSGDIDINVVPHAFTQLCIESLNRPVVEPWHIWTVSGPVLFGEGVVSEVTAGYVEVYDTLTYATVKGAGHEVPQYQPLFAYNMYERFIINKDKTLSHTKKIHI